MYAPLYVGNSLGNVAAQMLPKHGDGFLYFDNTQPQRLGGYNHFYSQFTKNNQFCNIDSLDTAFTNSSGKNTSIWLWKGDYNFPLEGGWHTGAEVGAYTNNDADDGILSSVSFTLSDSNGKVFDRHVDGQYWTNRFDPKKGNGVPSGLKLSATLTFKNGADAKAYYNALLNGGNVYDPSLTADGKERDSKTVKATAEMINANTVKVEFQ